MLEEQYTNLLKIEEFLLKPLRQDINVKKKDLKLEKQFVFWIRQSWFKDLREKNLDEHKFVQKHILQFKDKQKLNQKKLQEVSQKLQNIDSIIFIGDINKQPIKFTKQLKKNLYDKLSKQEKILKKEAVFTNFVLDMLNLIGDNRLDITMLNQIEQDFKYQETKLNQYIQDTININRSLSFAFGMVIINDQAVQYNIKYKSDIILPHMTLHSIEQFRFIKTPYSNKEFFHHFIAFSETNNEFFLNIMPDYIENYIKMFNVMLVDPDRFSMLQLLYGINDIDLHILTNNILIHNDATDFFKDLDMNIFKLAEFFRALPIAEKIIDISLSDDDTSIPFHEAFSINLKPVIDAINTHNVGKLKKGSYQYYDLILNNKDYSYDISSKEQNHISYLNANKLVYIYNNTLDRVKNLAILIQDKGCFASQYPDGELNFNSIKDHFDKTICIGTNNVSLNFLYIQYILNKIKNQYSDLDSLFFIIFKHGDIEDSKAMLMVSNAIKTLFENSAMNVFGYLRSCNSGKYNLHDIVEPNFIIKNAVFITSSAKDETSQYIDDYNYYKHNNYFKDTKFTIPNFIRFTTSVKESTPHISAVLGEIIITNQSFNQFDENYFINENMELISKDLSSSIVGAALSGE